MQWLFLSWWWTSLALSSSQTSQMVGKSYAVAVVPTVGDSVAIRAQSELALSEFHVAWQQLWLESERQRGNMVSTRRYQSVRRPFIHCHVEQRGLRSVLPGGLETRVAPATSSAFSDYGFSRSEPYVAIPSEFSRFAVCPTWLLSPTIDGAADESQWRDGALREYLRGAATRARAAALATLDTAAAALPGDGWLAGQRVRLRIDQRDLAGAGAAARTCRAAPWWCAALSGFAAWAAQDLVSAESAFSAMRLAMPDSVRCDWADVTALLPLDRAREMNRRSCAEREAFAARLWWLADPLLRDPLNARSIEHDARRVLAMILQDGAQDERHRWEALMGGDALVDLLMRYGWPSYMSWDGTKTDDSHSDYLRASDDPMVAPYTTFEYVAGRVSTVASWRALAAPFTAQVDDWFLLAEDSTRSPSLGWWPQEHFAPSRRLVPLAELQVGMFRRQNYLLVAASTQLDHPVLVSAPGTTASAQAADVDVLLLASRAAGQVDSIAQVISPPQRAVTLRGSLADSPTILAIEARCGASTCGDARARLGMTPPPTLAAMKPGQIAISDPVLLDVTASPLRPTVLDVREPREDLLDQMRAGIRVGPGDRAVGLYWETYGIAATDTVDVAVRVSSDTTLSGLRRLGAALKLVDDPSTSMAFSWREPDIGRPASTLTGPIPVQMRTLTINLQELRPGTYLIEVSVQRGASGPVRGQRRVIVE